MTRSCGGSGEDNGERDSQIHFQSSDLLATTTTPPAKVVDAMQVTVSIPELVRSP